jgi:hypothetical protein
MEIFALMGVIDYEGDMLLGLYASLEEATNARNIYTRDRYCGFDSYYVDRRAVGAPAEANFDDRIEV